MPSKMFNRRLEWTIIGSTLSQSRAYSVSATVAAGTTEQMQTELTARKSMSSRSASDLKAGAQSEPRVARTVLIRHRAHQIPDRATRRRPYGCCRHQSRETWIASPTQISQHLQYMATKFRIGERLDLAGNLRTCLRTQCNLETEQ